MKYFLIFLFIIGFSLNGFSQDLIVTNEGDSIQCEITKINIEKIRYQVKENNRLKSKSILKSDVKTSIPNYYESGIADGEETKSILDPAKFRLAIHGGFGYQTAKINSNYSSQIREYLKDLKSGYLFGADITFFINESIGLGVKYNNFNSSAVFGTVTVLNLDSTISTGLISDDVTVTFIGPSVTSRYLSFDNKNVLYTTLSIGMVGYNNDAVIIDDVNIKGRTIGVVYDIGWDTQIDKNIMLGIQASYTTGTLTKYDVTSGGYTQSISLQPEEYEGLNRLDITLGLRYTL